MRPGALHALALALAALAPAPAAAGGELVAPGPREKCPVCGMLVARYPQWIAGITYANGSHVVFDGPKDLLRFWLTPERYGARRRDDVRAVFVTEYYAVRQIDARAAWFVVGSDVLGPMGLELVPFATEGEARAFLDEHHGWRVVPFGDVDEALLRELG